MSDAPAIFDALAAVMVDVQAVAKNDRNTHQNFMFRGIDAVVNAVGPALRTHGVVVVPDVQDVHHEAVQTSQGKPSTACRVTVAYHFYAPDGSSVTATVAGEAWDSGDKATPKAMSVAFRTALLQALTLPTDEPDPDEHTYERGEAPAVDLAPLEAAIVTAQDVGLDKDWDELRRYAGQSVEHRDFVIDKVKTAVAEVDR